MNILGKTDIDDIDSLEGINYYKPKLENFENISSKDIPAEITELVDKNFDDLLLKAEKSLLEQAREIVLQLCIDSRQGEECYLYYKRVVDKKIMLYEQYAKEAEEKISDLKRLREKYFKEVGELKLQRQQFLKYTRNEIRKLKDEIEQLKQNKIEIGENVKNWLNHFLTEDVEDKYYAISEEKELAKILKDQLQKTGLIK